MLEVPPPSMALAAQRLSRRRPVIAVLTEYLDRSDGGYEYALRRAFSEACREHDLDLVVISGEALDDPRAEHSTKNRIYQLVDKEGFDGVVLLTAGLAAFAGISRLAEHLEHLRGLPLCSLGMVMPGVPSVTADNQIGISRLVEHVIVDHRCRQLVFLGSYRENEEIELRKEAVLAVCERHGISIAPDRMLAAGLDIATSEVEVTRLLESDDEFDAIVCANDGSAVGALRALERKSQEALERVVVTGFDDIPLANLLTRPLSTVRQPLALLAKTAISLIVQQLRGQEVPRVIELPTEVVLRASCGCVPAAVRRESEGPPPEEFARAAPSVSSDDDVMPLRQQWELAITNLRNRSLERISIENMHVQVLDVSAKFSRSADLTELELNLTKLLPTVHRRDIFVHLFVDATGARLRRVVRLENERVADSTGALLAANGAALTELCGADAPRVSIVLPLTARESFLGIVGFFSLDECFDYLLLRDQIANALQVVLLHDEVLHQTMISERNAQERQAAADRSNALAALAAGVAHDLNNALGSLVALTDVVCDEVDVCIRDGQPLGDEIRSDLAAMKSGAMRAAETIKDLMTLGRIGRTRHEPFDVGSLARKVTEELCASVPLSLGKQVTVTCQSPSEHLVVIGSEPHVERAIGNLVRNAVEAVDTGGRVEVTVAAEDRTQATRGYESIPAGTYAVISVQDYGSGIAPEQLRRIFEPFFSTKRLGDNSGSGLGLAIVHSVAKEHQGYVDVVSSPGSGARFSILLPRVSASPEARNSSGPRSFGPARILVVDDDLTQLRTAKRVLTRLGYDVVTTASGTEAFLLATESSANAPPNGAAFSSSSGFDLVIMDLALNQDDDGLTVMRRIRAVCPRQRGILASGHAFLDHEQEIRDANLVWLPKPYTVESLSDAIGQALRRGTEGDRPGAGS